MPRTLMTLLGSLCLILPHGGELAIERVFGPEIKTGPYKHPACLTELDNGDLYLVHYGGEGRVCHRHGRLRRAQEAAARPPGRIPSRSRMTRFARWATA